MQMSIIEPLVSLAFSVYTNKGVYALLLGSGLSSAAGIPTGWAVVEDLVRKLAVAMGEDPPAAAAKWYNQRVGETLGYSQLLDKLAATPEERLNMLRGYFVPTAEEREQGRKIPTQAHHQIAELAFGVFDPGKKDKAKLALEEFLQPNRVVSMHAPKFTPDSELGAMLRTAVVNRCLAIQLNRKAAL